ncbi:hypothetical protein HYH03_015201 [Edaphochlamys debaryana]|uniref:Protein kinase domain-containing protein n=1 Tax=Edaphochlamys debaryana TaxID=47281 RepID=A0A835XLL0_9CHLO|nr:hypothetical protein HYH03_015201 [Edaphochlamys debaryana]|eukprot:KAG2486106.1 hypothetical protein HYH03_015201 [Edaphochlamys debaryana]
MQDGRLATLAPTGLLPAALLRLEVQEPAVFQALLTQMDSFLPLLDPPDDVDSRGPIRPIALLMGNASKFWAWDEQRLCQAYVRHPNPSVFVALSGALPPSGFWVITPRPCSWGLGFVCVAEADAAAAGFTSASAWYRRYLAPGAPEATQPSPYAQGPQGSGLVLLRSGLVLGDPTPGRGITAPTGEWANVTVAFDDSEAFWAEGPVLSYISRNQECCPGALLLLRQGTYDQDAYNIWQRAVIYGVTKAWGNSRGQLAGQDVRGIAEPNWDTAFVDPSMYDYVVSVQGCFREDSLERLMLVTRTGRRYQLGMGGCTYAFREDAPPGGYLAGVAGRYIDWYAVPRWLDLNLPAGHFQAWFTRLQLVWAAPAGANQPTFALSSPSVLLPSPPLAADVTGSTCVAGMAGGMLIASRVLPPRELWVSVCGPQANASCPSQLCCGDRFLGPGNVSYATCGASAAACQAPACLPGYGVCGGGGVPEAQQVVFVRSDPARQDWPPPRSAEAGSGSGSGGGGATTVYAVRPRAAIGGAWYQNAVAYCRSSSLMGLSWRLIGRADLMGWVDSLDMRLGGINTDDKLLVAEDMWLEADDEDMVARSPEVSCLKGLWRRKVLRANIALDLSNGFFRSSCRADGTVICKASGAQNRSTLVAAGSAAWGAGIHTLSTSPAFGGGPTATCRYALGPAATANGGNSSSGSNAAAPAAALPRPIARIDLSIGDQLFPDGCQAAIAVVAGVRVWLQMDASAAGAEPSQVAGSETNGGWHRFELAAGEVVTGVSGCAGGYVERLVFHTSLGRLWTTPFSAASLCSASFAEVAPPGGYLVGLQGESGTYLHSVQMVWGQPLASGGGAPPPPPAAAAGPAPAPTPAPAAVQPPSLLTTGGSDGAVGNATAESGGSSGGVSAGVIAGAAVGAAVGVALFGAAAAVLLVVRRRRLMQGADAAKPSEPTERRKQGSAGDRTSGADPGSESASAVGNGSVVVRVGEDPSAAAVGLPAPLWTHRAPMGPNGPDGTASVLKGTDHQFEKRLAAYMLGLNSVRQAASSADNKWALSSDAMSTSTHQGSQSVGAGSDGEGSLASMLSRAQAELGGAQEHLRIDGVLGRGSFGVVYLGTWRGLLVAVKTLVVHDALMGREGRQRHRAILEAAISKSLKHPHVVTTYACSLVPLGVVGARVQGQGKVQGPAQQAAAQEGQAPAAEEGKASAAGDSPAQGPSSEQAPGDADVYKLLLIQEYCNLGSLTSALGAGASGSVVAGGVEALCALSIALDVACGMSYIHSRNIIHGDLSPGNVLLSSRASEEPSSHGLAPTQGDPSASRGGQVPGGGWRPPVHARVADFGLSLPMQGDQTHASHCFQGTPSHTAPEVLIQGRLSRAADVWAFGVLLLELCHGTPIRNIRAKAAAAAAGAGAALPGPRKDDAAGEGSPDQGTAPGAVDEVAVSARTPPWAVPPPGLPPPLALLVTACLALEPTARPTFAEVADALGVIVRELEARHVAAHGTGLQQ